MDRSLQLSIDDLARQAAVPVRTVRYYISQGLLPGPSARGKAASYSAEHLARLRLIRRLADEHVPLAEQRQRLERLSYGEIEALLDEDARQTAELERASRAPSPQAYISGLLDRARQVRAAPYAAHSLASPAPAPPDAVKAYPPVEPKAYDPIESRTPEEERWRRWQLLPGIELHVREDVLQTHAQLIERLRQISRS